MSGARIGWGHVLVRAREVVRSIEGYGGVTLRQLFYRLVAEGQIPNTVGAYKTLSDRTARAREAGEFPALVDRGRSIHRPMAFDDVDDALGWMTGMYRRDRTEGQPVSLYVGVEKDTLREVLISWLDPYGIPVIVVHGWSSISYNDGIRDDIRRQERPAVLLYLGDLDPSGEAIESKIATKLPTLAVRRIGLTLGQAVELDLPENQGVAKKLARSPGRIAFVEKYGRLFQIEVDAIPLAILKGIVMETVRGYLDTSSYNSVLAEENDDRRRLAAIMEVARGT